MTIHVATRVRIQPPPKDSAKLPPLRPITKDELIRALVEVAIKIGVPMAIDYVAKVKPRREQVFEFEDWLWSLAPKEPEIRAELLPQAEPAPAQHVPPAPRNEPEPEPIEAEIPAPSVPADVLAAAELLGVAVWAMPERIRQETRARIAASRSHPDHGGDGEQARRLLDARDLLLDYARNR